MEKLSLHGNRHSCLLRKGVMVITLVVTAASASMIGGESGSYLRYPSGAAALAMGGAGAAAPQYLLSWWNPSQLCHLRNRHAAFGGGIRPFGQTDGFAALEFRVPPRMGMGLFILYRGDPFIDNLYDENENPYPTASYTTITGKIAISYYINRRFSAGCNIAIRYASLPSGFSDGTIVSTSENSMGSFDFALTYNYSDDLILTAQLKNVGATLDWNFASYDYNVPSESVIPVSLLVGSSYRTSVMERPFIWNTDMRVWFPDGSEGRHSEVSLSSGVEWRYWEKLHVRMGLGDVRFNSDILENNEEYWRTFAFRLATGLSYDLSKVRRGMRCNYAISTDKVWAGVDQQLDVTWQF